ncbi:MAG: F0F1 ATP synthase subunit A [Patescibacteria group bacterium]
MEISLAAEPIFHIGSFTVTNTLLSSWIAVLILVIIAFAIRRKVRVVPKGLQNLAEVVLEYFLKLTDTVTQSRKQSVKFFPVVMTIFLFILVSNYLGLFPGFGAIGINEIHDGHEVFVPILRTVNSDLNVTLALAIISVMATNFVAILLIGFVKTTKRFINLKNPIFTFVGFLEFISELAKFISFSFRLFGNIFAGEVLLVVISSLMPFIAPLPFYFLELFVGLIQAFVFAVLTLVFMKVAAEEAH